MLVVSLILSFLKLVFYTFVELQSLNTTIGIRTNSFNVIACNGRKFEVIVP